MHIEDSWLFTSRKAFGAAETTNLEPSPVLSILDELEEWERYLKAEPEVAATVNERLGAMRAEISLIDKEEVWITFDEMLWLEDKEPTSALAVAAKLGFEVEQEISLLSEPFAWPELGSMTADTAEFMTALLKAYDEHGVIKR